MKPGIFLKSTSLLDDTIFEKSLIFIAGHDMGFIVNKEFPRQLNELEEFKNILPFPIYLGGPVDQEHLYFIHQRPDLIEGGEAIADNVFLGGDFKSAVKNIDNSMISEKDIKIFIGYCGWDYPELEEEIAEGSWEILEVGDAFSRQDLE